MTNKVSLALDGWTSSDKLAITSVIAYYMEQNVALREVQVAFDEVDHLFFSLFECYLGMLGQGPTFCSKASGTFEGRC